MRILTWLSAAGLLVALAWGVSSVAHRDAVAARDLTAAKHAAVVAGASTGLAYDDPSPQRMIPRPSPDPTPTPPPPAPRVAAAPVAAPVHQAAPAPAISVRTTQQALINQDRARYGLAPLTWSSCLYNVAVSNAQRMARQGYISHTNGPNVDLTCGLGSRAGENVGYWSGGINDGQLNTMFMNSPDHRANILGPYHYVATAWAVGANGTAYIAVEFG